MHLLEVGMLFLTPVQAALTSRGRKCPHWAMGGYAGPIPGAHHQHRLSPHFLLSSISPQGPALQTGMCSLCFLFREPSYTVPAGRGGSSCIRASAPVGIYGGPRVSKWVSFPFTPSPWQLWKGALALALEVRGWASAFVSPQLGLPEV